MSSANGDKVRARNELRVALRARMRDREAILVQRENDPHSVDLKMLSDLSHSEGVLAARLQALGGDPYDGDLAFEEQP
jgi:hypothetical protein